VALSYFEDLYGENPFSNVLLEEIERDKEDDTPYWFITFVSFVWRTQGLRGC
jgi:hypothetical protein